MKNKLVWGLDWEIRARNHRLFGAGLDNG